MRIASSALGLLVLLAGGSHAGTTPFYDGGLLSFSYRQIPFGNDGTFHSDGTIPSPSAFPAGDGGATTAICAEADGTAYLMVAGGARNADGTVDAALLLLTAPAPLTPGSYPIDPVGATALFAFLDDASGLVLPADPATVDFAAWTGSIPAAHKLSGVLGRVQLTIVDAGRLQGMFVLTATDVASGALVAAPDGIFSVGATVSVALESWGTIKGRYRK